MPARRAGGTRPWVHDVEYRDPGRGGEVRKGGKKEGTNEHVVERGRLVFVFPGVVDGWVEAINIGFPGWFPRGLE